MKGELDELVSENCKRLDSLFVSLGDASLDFLVLGELGLLTSSLIVLEDSGHAVLIAALVVDKNESGLAFPADIAEHIKAAAVDVNVALSLKKMIVRNTLKA